MGNSLIRLPVAAIAMLLAAGSGEAQKTVTLTLPSHSRLTPVQRLNRRGVKAVERHDYQKAGSLFLKAYLYDPADPFTLNNLGYISELQGQMAQADRFYRLSAEQESDADIAVSNVPDLEGRPMQTAFAGLRDIPMEINSINVEAMNLLGQSRGEEAVRHLQRALALDAKNPFTLNNLGAAYEATGDFARAIDSYRGAARAPAAQQSVVSSRRAWEGRSVGEVAQANIARLETTMAQSAASQTRASVLNLQGVYAGNQNDWRTARRDFLEAYRLNPGDAFSLNNRGYVAELDGDLESAQYFYARARRALGAGVRVGVATRQSAEGARLGTVATDSSGDVGRALDLFTRERRQESAPVELTPRGEGLSPSPQPPSGEHQPDARPQTQSQPAQPSPQRPPQP